MISLSGIRGIFGQTLTPEIVLKYAAHYGIFCNRKTVIIGRDSRTSGETLRHAVISGLLSVGCKVIDLGIVSTPTLLLAVEESDAAGGICITASHNPAEWNALKLCGKNGMFLFPGEAERFLATLEKGIVFAPWNRLGTVFYDKEAAKRHIAKIVAVPYLDLQAIKKRNFTVVVDSVNGAGGTISPPLLRALGCNVIEINSEPNGIFAHNPEPLAKNLKQLEETVLEHKADLGLATDPDVDRLSLVSEKGEAVGEEFSLLLASEFVLQKKKGDLVTNLSTSMAIDDIAAKHGVEVHRTKVGEINVGKLMTEISSPIGGEGNGGIICPEVHYTRDAPVGMALILGLLAERKQPLSEIIESLPKYYICKSKLEVEPQKLDPIMKKAEELFQDRNIDKTDGLKILGEKYWIHIRKSGTEPIIRIYVESNSEKQAEQLCNETVTTLLEA
jgi:phosphomannomutase